MLLLDSQAALWLLDDNPKLGPQARAEIASSGRVHVSTATVWELTIKSMLGMLTILANFADHLSAQGLQLLSITPQHAEGIREFPELMRHDPFDRLIISQAVCDGLRLLTADRALLDLKKEFVVDASE